ncbi:MAG TPA: DUF2085 domain-containing protein [bacterium]|nr:DUF2085 domain-containing protein [bacterium]
MSPRRIYLLVLAGAAAACALVFAPVLEAGLGGSGAVNAVARLAFSKVCHQMPERSLWLSGVCLPVCARCTGIYAGFMLGWLCWRMVPEPRRGRPISTALLLAGIAPLGVDGLINTTTLITSPAWFRVATGLLVGAVAARALWPALLEAAKIIQEAYRQYFRAGAGSHAAAIQPFKGDRT